MAPKKQAKSLFHLRWLLLLPIPAVWCVLSHFGALTFLETRSIDWRFKYRGELSSPVNVVYVDVDSLSISAIGNMPWSRSYFARVCSALVNEAKVRAVGIDFVLSEAGIPEAAEHRRHVAGNIELGRFLNQQPPVVLAAAYGGWRFLDINHQMRERALPLVAGEVRPLDQLEPPELPGFDISAVPDQKRLYHPPHIGLIDTIGNDTRLVPAWAPSNMQRTFFHMAVELARLYWGLPAGAVKIDGDRLLFTRADGSVHAAVPLLAGQMLEVNWFTRWYSTLTTHVEFSDVFSYAEMLTSTEEDERNAAKEFFTQEGFKDAVVLIGPVDPLLQDLAPTPLNDDAVPKVGIHGNLLKTIVSGLFLRRPSATTNHAIAFALAALVLAITIVGGSRALLAKFAAALLLGAYVVLAFELFRRTHLILPLAAPMGAAFTTSFAGLVWQVVDEQRAKSRIKGMFGTYVSPQLVERMIESGEEPQLGGHDSEITAYFSDIQSFSAFSEKLPSGPLVELMNEYLTACTEIVQAQGGTLDKYIGDAVVAMFGAPITLPDHAYRACIATQLVQQRLGGLRAKWRREGDRWPDIVWTMQSRIGLNTGVCMIGNMGSRTRFNYTMMGDNVNLAARMESGGKKWGAYTMCTEATKVACERHGADRVVFRALGRIVVVGRSQPVPIFEIVGLKESLAPAVGECVGLFEQGLAKYHARDWKGAIALFKQSAGLEPNQPGKIPGVKTNPSLVYIEIAESHEAKAPPAGWEGVHVMKEK